MKILQNTTMGAADANQFRGTTGEAAAAKVSPESIKMAISMVTIIPILLVYPFVQRFFVQGMTLGAVKS